MFTSLAAQFLVLSAHSIPVPIASPVPRPWQESDTALEARARAIFGQVVEKPTVEKEWFMPAFLEVVSASRMRSILRRTFKKSGVIIDFQRIDAPEAFSGRFRASGEEGYEFTLNLGVDPQAPYAIRLLFISALTLSDYTQVEKKLVDLPGEVSFGVYGLGEESLSRVYTLNPEARLGVGSAFKLYVLGALAQEISEGKRAWEDSIRLREEYKSLPSGFLQAWPAEAPITLHTLAALMISQSDNTATDHLLFTLGRKRVESQLFEMGNRHVLQNSPFLSTAELFRLKASDSGTRARAYLELSVEDRYAYLRDEIAPVPVSSVDMSTLLMPNFIDTIEWFASTDDLARTFNWLRRAIVAGDETTAGILSINSGAVLPPGMFRYIAFKGGSEGGVLNLSYLVQTHDERWWVIVANWNNSQAPVTTNTLLEICTSALTICAKEAELALPR